MPNQDLRKTNFQHENVELCKNDKNVVFVVNI